MIALDSAVAKMIAQCLLHFLWQGAVLGVLAMVALRVPPARMRYGIACAFFFLMAIAPVVTFMNLQTQAGGGAALTMEPVRAIAMGAGFPGGRTFDGAWFQVVLGVWMAGVTLGGMRVAGGWAVVLRRSSARRRMAVDAWIIAAAGRISARLGISKPVRIFASASATVPTVIGAWRPLILLPASVIAGLPQEQLEAVIAHELAHVARHDFVVNLAQCVVEVLLFFHPAVWWLSRQIREEREMCCDAIAAELCGDRLLYSRALLALEEQRAPIGLALAASGGDLRLRIERLMGIERRRASGSGLALTAVVLVCAATAFALQAQKPEGPYQKWLTQDVVYIINDREKQAFEALKTDEERNHFIEQFWDRRNPKPGAATNEMKQEHYRRIAYANNRFETEATAGWATARGRAYILYGPPDEMESHPKELREEWRYKTGRWLVFSGKDYAMMRQKAAP